MGEQSFWCVGQRDFLAVGLSVLKLGQLVTLFPGVCGGPGLSSSGGFLLYQSEVKELRERRKGKRSSPYVVRASGGLSYPQGHVGSWTQRAEVGFLLASE